MNQSVIQNQSFTQSDPVNEGTLKYQDTWGFIHKDNPNFAPLWFEHHDNLYWRKLVWENPFYPYIAIAVYLVTIFGIQHVMKNRPPLSLKTPLLLWNWGLGIFSIVGCLRVAPELGYLIWGEEDGLHNSLCGRTEHYIPTAFWGLLFCLSKSVELGDTVFIVLKKQPLLALQWYHHAIVTAFAWVLYSWQESILRWYAFMNYGVHAIMYPYFALRGMNVKVPEMFAMAITTLQVLQMIAGVVFNMYAVYIWGKGEKCFRNPYSVAFSLLTYLSLWILFAQFFISKYISRTRKKNKVE